MRVPRRRFLQLTAAAATVLAVISLISGLLPMAASAQLRAQPVRIVFPFAPGGSGDALARLVADQMLTSVGRPAIVENRGQAGQDALASAQSRRRRQTAAPC